MQGPQDPTDKPDRKKSGRKPKGGVKFRYWVIEVRRRELKMTQADLARATGMTQASISNLEGGNYMPSALNLWHLANALRQPLDTFFEEVPEDAEGS
jgi:DNA-binding XRE family transcriptional regulator